MARLKVVVDTNVLVSALLFGGGPRAIFELALDEQIQGIASPQLLAELSDVLLKKFDFSTVKTRAVERKIKERFKIVQPRVSITVLKDQADNRVLEAAVAGRCDFIITGDKELLALKKFRGIVVVPPKEFISSSFPN